MEKIEIRVLNRQDETANIFDMRLQAHLGDKVHVIIRLLAFFEIEGHIQLS